ncbi:zinc finger protein 511 lethal (2) k10201 [Haematobia irritans]|uniref:zinc finger protein 511 lethal (2) k10201 n=1 Tax=Haematobia irritans TaxID=7368 RepID=UPI003F4F91B6
MLSLSQIEDLLTNIPSGFLKPDDTFFASSNTMQYKKLGSISSCEPEKKTEEISSSNNIYCNVMNCTLVFDNVAAYKLHYNRMHRFTCQECKKSGFPTEHLLDIHIIETHDTYFKARLDRGESLYKCYVEECIEIFLSPEERRKHCIEEHKFPANYRFDQAKNIMLPSKEDNRMEIDNCGINSKETLLKNFSFGHQQERTFLLKNVKQQSGKTFADLNSLKRELDSM